ncbi:prepilin peptidase [Aidingimonas lacisalsi]|uniref:prepilin peptidase n=1 Tax=Aidingimonas lacisalsi TaxID=2604086 RepID=UPI0011D237EB|nr:A24 family peptidase [Aidingimonas lacisalsi]
MSVELPSPLLWLLTLLLGLCLGSFMNVVITRVPVMLMRRWRAEARAALELPAEETSTFNLLTPSSMCPRCEYPITWRDKLPLVGYVLCRGRCAQCQTRISPQYPLIELAGAGLTVAVVAIHGASLASLMLIGVCLALLALAVIDFRTQLLPDAITLPLLWAGLGYHLWFQPLWLANAVIGAMAGYLVLWGFYWLFKLLTGKEGMGYGDFKLLAALGAWLGWPFLPLLLILSAGLGAIIGLTMQFAMPRLRGMPIPFGPFLAMAGWIAILFDSHLMSLYQGLLL